MGRTCLRSDKGQELSLRDPRRAIRIQQKIRPLGAAVPNRVIKKTTNALQLLAGLSVTIVMIPSVIAYAVVHLASGDVPCYPQTVTRKHLPTAACYPPAFQ